MQSYFPSSSGSQGLARSSIPHFAKCGRGLKLRPEDPTVRRGAFSSSGLGMSQSTLCPSLGLSDSLLMRCESAFAISSWSRSPEPFVILFSPNDGEGRRVSDVPHHHLVGSPLWLQFSSGSATNSPPLYLIFDSGGGSILKRSDGICGGKASLSDLITTFVSPTLYIIWSVDQTSFISTLGQT